jgi:hypothetical protein
MGRKWLLTACSNKIGLQGDSHTAGRVKKRGASQGYERRCMTARSLPKSFIVQKNTVIILVKMMTKFLTRIILEYLINIYVVVVDDVQCNIL